MIVLIVTVLISASFYLVFYQFKLVKFHSDTAHLPSRVLKDDTDIELPLKSNIPLSKFNKTWLPFTSKFKAYDDRIKASGLRRRIIKAGSPIGLLEFLAFKLLAILIVPIVAFMIIGESFPPPAVLGGGFLLGYLIPEIWLNRKIKRRQANIRKDLPSIIDLLNLCVSGGLDFMLAVNRVIKDLKPCDMTMELAEVYRETQMGKSRKEALKNFAWRVDTPEVFSFVRTLIQAERMGTPIGETLRVQAEEMRIRRFQRGEAQALKAPIKLLLPLFAFILPVVLIIVAGPILLQFTQSKIGF